MEYLVLSYHGHRIYGFVNRDRYTHEQILFTLSLHGVHEAFYHRARRRHGLLSYALNLISRLRMIRRRRRRSAAQQRTNANERTPS